MQYTIKILLNSLFGATAMNGFRYGNILIGEAITLTGQRIIQESALEINNTCHKLLSGNIDKEVFTN
jgi:DNA polymerase elongation subunit (family B)